MEQSVGFLIFICDIYRYCVNVIYTLANAFGTFLNQVNLNSSYCNLSQILYWLRWGFNYKIMLLKSVAYSRYYYTALS